MDKGYYGSRYAFDSKRVEVWKSIASYLQKYVPKRSVVLDLGCGYCDFINNIKAAKKYAVDISDIGKKYSGRNVRFYKASSTRLPFEKDLFDVVFCSNLFEHLKKEELNKTINEVKRVLKPEGSLIILQPNHRYCVKEYFDDYTHELVFTHISLSDFLESRGFRVKVCEKRLLPFSVSKSGFVPGFMLGFLVKLYLSFPVRPFAKQMLVVAVNKKA
jgi:ubiquinone/menaquinone biosynthesis C-methylase UbiE